MSKILRVVAFIVISALTMGFLEWATRLYYNEVHDLNIEMWKYAKTLKGATSIPGLGHWHRPHSHAKLFGVDTVINSKGLRDREFEYEKKADTFRILTFGDCMVFGWGVPLEKTSSKLLETHLNQTHPNQRFEVLNFGVGNYNTVQEHLLLNAEGWKYQPDMVLLYVFLNDPEPMYSNTRSNWLLEHSQLASLLWCRLIVMGSIFKGESQGSYYRNLFDDQSTDWKSFKGTFTQIIEDCQKRNVAVGVVFLPVLYKLEGDYPFIDIHQKLEQLAVENKVASRDIYQAFKGMKTQDFLLSPSDPHYNAKAHTLVAEESRVLAESILKAKNK